MYKSRRTHYLSSDSEIRQVSEIQQQRRAARTANYQQQESRGESKGNQQGGNPKTKIYCQYLQ